MFGYSGTAGCIGFSENDLLKILEHMNKESKVVIKHGEYIKMEYSKDINIQVKQEVQNIMSIAIKKYNNSHFTNRNEVITPGRFFGAFEDLLLQNWHNFEANEVPCDLKRDLTNMIAREISAPFLSRNLYINSPGRLIQSMTILVQEYPLKARMYLKP